MTEQITHNIYRIGVLLPDNPLRELNSYVIKTAERNLIIDTGFNRPECLKALQQGIRELDLDMERTDIFLTHLHADHSGLVTQIMAPGSRIYMSKVDKILLDQFISANVDYWKKLEARFLEEGFPPDELDAVNLANPARKYVTPGAFEAITLVDGSEVVVGDVTLECIFTPGHTPGHMCLYYRKEKILFSGDHVLFDITPNISIWMDLESPLENYFESLRKIYPVEVDLCLPGHRANNKDLRGRVEALLQHHTSRLRDVARIVGTTKSLTAYEVTKKVKWAIRAKNWAEFPAGQKWFAMGEGLTHLAYLTNSGIVERTCTNGIFHYALTGKSAETINITL